MINGELIVEMRKKMDNYVLYRKRRCYDRI